MSSTRLMTSRSAESGLQLDGLKLCCCVALRGVLQAQSEAIRVAQLSVQALVLPSIWRVLPSAVGEFCCLPTKFVNGIYRVILYWLAMLTLTGLGDCEVKRSG